MPEPGRVAHGQVIDGKYQLVTLVAEGEHGELWRGELRGAGGFLRPVAVKVVPAAVLPQAIDTVRFLAQARRSAVLEHANIVQVQDLAHDRAGHYHVISEWVEGQSLRELLDGIERLGLQTPWPIVVAIGVGLLRGLASAHGHVDADGEPDPLLHGALSPDRILIGVNGVAKLAGFAMLGAADPRAATAEDLLAYQAPEVSLRVAWSTPADVFGIGAILWEALVGDPPFGGEIDAVAFHSGEATLPSLARARPGLPSRLVEVIDRALAFGADDRFAGADEMAAELAPLLAGVRWLRGPQTDLGRAVREARASLGRTPRAAVDIDDLLLVSQADIGMVEVPAPEADEPILLTRLAAQPLSDDDLLVVDDDR